MMADALSTSVLKGTTAAHPVVVDLGCGTGTDGLRLLTFIDTVLYVGVDSSSAMLGLAREKLAQRGLAQRSLLLNSNFRKLTSGELLSEIRSYQLESSIVCVMSTLS